MIEIIQSEELKETGSMKVKRAEDIAIKRPGFWALALNQNQDQDRDRDWDQKKQNKQNKQNKTKTKTKQALSFKLKKIIIK